MFVVKEIPIPIYFGVLVIIFTDELEKLNIVYKTNIQEDDYEQKSFNLYYGNGVVD